MSTKLKDIYVVRQYRDSDKNFVLATFLRGLYYGNEFYNMILKQEFMDNYKLIAEALLAPERNMIHVAVLSDDSDVILGYSVVSHDHETLHWVFVKAAWRKQGIAKSLIPATINTYSHFTTVGLSLAKKFPNLIFNPFKI